MEQFIFLILRMLSPLALCLIMVGCRSEDPNPEARDPIYKALLEELSGAEKGLEEAKSEKIKKYTELGEKEDRTIEKKQVEKSYWKAVKQVTALTTAVEYLKIRTERRRVETRRSYREAFKAHKEEEWPSTSEYSGYLTNKRLREVSLNWSRRVPKLKDRIPSSEAPAVAEGSKEGSGESEE